MELQSFSSFGPIPLIRFKSSAPPSRAAVSVAGLVPSSAPSRTPSPSKSSPAAASAAALSAAAVFSAAACSEAAFSAAALSAATLSAAALSAAAVSAAVFALPDADVLATAADVPAATAALAPALDPVEPDVVEDCDPLSADLAPAAGKGVQNSQLNTRPSNTKTKAPKKAAGMKVYSPTVKSITNVSKPATAAIAQHPIWQVEFFLISLIVTLPGFKKH